MPALQLGSFGCIAFCRGGSRILYTSILRRLGQPQQQPCDSPKYSAKVASSVWRTRDPCPRRSVRKPIRTFTCWVLACATEAYGSFARPCVRATATGPVSALLCSALLSRSAFSVDILEKESKQTAQDSTDLHGILLHRSVVFWCLNSCKYVY